MKKHLEIRVKGIVQGVGFRPFIFQMAKKHNIFGNVINDTEGVLIQAEGEEQDVDSFLLGISECSPPLSYIRSITSKEMDIEGYSDFSIGKSKISDERSAFYSPDVAVCDECLEEFFNKNDRRFRYPFITCINCGPRFSIIHDIPYDRKNTSMTSFDMCKKCHDEFSSYTDRRFHSQPNACYECGPQMFLYNNRSELISSDIKSIAEETIKLIKKGYIIAVKGIGGYHLVADAMNDDVVIELRRRKNRPFKPFALMAGSIDVINSFASVSPMEKELLLSKERPIVLVKEQEKCVSRFVAPGMSYSGIMLPYTPFQHLLFSIEKNIVLIMTSGNISDEPIVYEDDAAFKILGTIADYFVTYNREIIAQSDDSVLYVVNERPFFIRRSRGYIPIPFNSKETNAPILALGGDLKNSFAIAKKDFIILSQYLGDMADLLTFQIFRKTVNHFIKIFDAEPRIVVSDMHPGYITAAYADELEGSKIRKIQVQHHHAHIASVLEERNIDDKVIGVAFDGTGYGTDGTLWGSEFLICNKAEFTRVGHFSYFPLPGGESAIKDVWKIGLSLLYKKYGHDFPIIKKNATTDNLIEIMNKGIHSPQTCSIGRIFDGVSAVLGLSETITTEAEAAQLLEESALKSKGNIPPYEIPFTDNTEIIISTEELIGYVVELIEKGLQIEDISFAFHHAIVYTSIIILKKIRERSSINKVALSGGVFHNRVILSLMIEYLENAHFEVYTPERVPFNDGCIALGQIAVAKEIV